MTTTAPINTRVTVVVPDALIVANGVIMQGATLEQAMLQTLADIFAQDTIHAIQWNNDSGHVEYADGRKNTLLSSDDYTNIVEPFVTLWEQEKNRREAAQVQAEADALALYNSTEARAKRLRAERDARLAACQWIIERYMEQATIAQAAVAQENTQAGELADGQSDSVPFTNSTAGTTTLTSEGYQAWLAYRQALRDLPQQTGFPWNGGGSDDTECPWPVEPSRL